MTTRSRRAAIVVALALFVVGCDSAMPPPLYQGVLRLAWTIQGQPASDATCAGIDHLVITVESSPSLVVEIEPVRCVDGVGWERDDMPEGTDTVVVDAVDAAKQTLLERIATLVGVTATPAATPTMLDLQPR